MHCCTLALCSTVYKEKVYVLRLKLTHTALVTPRGGTLGISGWGCAAGTLEEGLNGVVAFTVIG